MMDLSSFCAIVMLVILTTAEKPPWCKKCICGGLGRGGFEVICPINDDSSINLKLDNSSKVKHLDITCNSDLSNSTDYTMLDGLQVGSVQSVKLVLCSIPDSLSNLLDGWNASDVNTLLIELSTNINHLKKRQFYSFKNLTKLLLINSNITKLDVDVFEDLHKLTMLNMHQNNIEQLPLGLLSSLYNLTILDLGDNQIKYFIPGVFKNLSKLNSLSLWDNPIENITRSVLKDVASIELLELRGNGFEALPSDVFSDLVNLKTLGLRKSNFASLPEGLFSKLKQLTRIDLSNNNQQYSLPPGLLSNLLELVEVNLASSQFSELPDDLFWGSPEIKIIQLEKNALNELPKSLFQDSVKLEKLDISFNQLHSIPESIFNSLVKLKLLKLNNNLLTKINRDTFSGLALLENLHLERNQLVHIDLNAFSNTNILKKLYLSHNYLTFNTSNAPQSPINHCKELEILDLANNSIDGISEDWLYMPKLSKLNLSFNKIDKVETHDLQFLGSSIQVNLENNMITKIDLKSLELIFLNREPVPSQDPTSNIQIRFKGNPLHCDCGTYFLLRYIEHELKPGVYKAITLDTKDLKCATPENVSGQRISTLNSKTILCSLMQKECPSPCECWERVYDKTFIVNCTGKKLERAPKYLPKPIGKYSRTEIRLDFNKLQSLPFINQPGYDQVTQIYASHNNISSLDERNIPIALEILELDNNDLMYIGHSALNLLANKTNLQRVTVFKNPFTCNCDARDLLNFVLARFTEVDMLSNATCADGRQLLYLSADELCPVSNNIIIASSLSIAALGIIIGLLAAFYYRYQQEIKVWLYSHDLCLWFVTEEELDKDKHYDAFVSYSHIDELFVVNELVPGLESGPTPFKLCLHYRDWIAGDWIPNQIARSVEDSRRTMIILSPNFLESVWGRMEFRAAHSQALSEGRARVIVVLYGDIGPLDGLDPELRAYLSMNTYVKWGDPWFWDKLRYALPHPPQRIKHSGMVINRPPDLTIITTRVDDKHELMSPTTPNSTTPPATIISNPMHQSNGHILSLTNGHTKFIEETNGQIKSI